MDSGRGNCSQSSTSHSLLWAYSDESVAALPLGYFQKMWGNEIQALEEASCPAGLGWGHQGREEQLKGDAEASWT